MRVQKFCGHVAKWLDPPLHGTICGGAEMFLPTGATMPATSRQKPLGALMAAGLLPIPGDMYEKRPTAAGPVWTVGGAEKVSKH